VVKAEEAVGTAGPSEKPEIPPPESAPPPPPPPTREEEPEPVSPPPELARCTGTGKEVPSPGEGITGTDDENSQDATKKSEAPSTVERYWEWAYHPHVAAWATLVLIGPAFWLAAGLLGWIWTLVEGYGFGCVVEYCGVQRPWTIQVWGQWESVCYPTMPLISLDAYEERRRCGLTYTRYMHTWHWGYGLDKYFEPWRFADVPMVMGLGRWLTLAQVTLLEPHTFTVLGVWEVVWAVAGMSAVVALSVWGSWTAIWWAHKRLVWFVNGDVVVRGGLGGLLKARAAALNVDLELLSFLYGNIAHKLRDNRTASSLQASGRAWVAKYRKDWSEHESVTQIEECVIEAMAITETERVAHGLWGTGVIHRGLQMARDLATGSLAWGRKLDA
jgi:hypothetical protein